MLNFILEFSVRRRPMVWLGVVLTTVLGIGAALRLPMDAVPDITSPQVQINTGVDGLAPEEIEKQVTVPIEHEMSGIPGMIELRSLSKSGLSQVTMIFQDGTDLYRARQLVSERLQQVAVELPDGLTPRLAPFATGLGEIYYYSLDYAPGAAPEGTSRREQLMALRWIHDSMVRPLLRQTPGLAEVNTSGGYERTHTVVPDLARMAAAGVAIGDLATVLMENTRNAGGGAVELGGELITVRANTRASGPADLGNLAVKFAGGVQPVRVRDLASTTIGTRFRTGASTEDGREALVGSAIMMAGENSRIVADAVRERLEAIQSKLPKGLIIRTLYDRSHLVERTLHTVERNLTEGALLVIAVLFVLLGNLRGAFIVALAIPLSMLFAMIGMVQLHIPGNLMSLGAIDFGLIIDGAVVMVENILRRLGGRQHEAGRPLTAAERVETVLLASKEVARPMVFGVLIITAVYGPVLALQGIEGKMFRPMAIVVMLALGGSLVLALTLMPALCAAWLTGPVAEKDNWAVGAAKRIYSPLLAFGLRHRMAILIPVVVLVAGSVHLFTRLGAEFIPELDEGDGILQLVKAQSAGLEASIAMQVRSEQVLLAAFPEIDRIFCRMGSAEIATDPMDPGDADTYIMLKPRDTWRKVDGRPRTKEQLLEAMQKTLEQNVPGQAAMINQPIQMRFDEIMAGARAELSLKIYGEDLAMLETLAEKSREVLRGIRGAADVELDKIGRTPQMQIMQDRTATERLNLHAGEINRAVELALGGEELGFLQEGGRRVPVRIQLSEADRSNPDVIRRIPIRTDGGNLLTLGRVITVSNLTQVGTLHRENGQRRVSILINVRGRDTESFVQEAGERLKAAVPLPEGCWMEFGGQFRNLVEAKRRLAIVVPIALGLILFFMYLSFSSLRQALLVFVCVPLATTGGVIALAMRDMPFTLSAGVGFIALSGIAVLNGIMLVSFINQLRSEGRELREAVLEGTLTRLRPKLMTALVASLGFVPMALSTSAGAEVQRPLATVVIGGIITSTLLTLIVIPVLYDWLERRQGADASTAAGTPNAREPQPQVP